jgi:hypothetical protein
VRASAQTTWVPGKQSSKRKLKLGPSMGARPGQTGLGTRCAVTVTCGAAKGSLLLWRVNDPLYQANIARSLPQALRLASYSLYHISRCVCARRQEQLSSGPFVEKNPILK